MSRAASGGVEGERVRVLRGGRVGAALALRSGKIGLVAVSAIVAIAVFGPFLTPHSPTEIIGTSFQAPSSEAWLGTDALGRDVLSRFLSGGLTLIAVALGATLLAYTVGVPVGLATGLRGGYIDLGVAGGVDLMMAFPPIVLILVLVAGVGSGLDIVVIAIAAVHAPRIVRLVRTVAMEIGEQEFIEAAVARGERFRVILLRDVLPNAWTPILADFGLRLTYSVILVSSLAYLGLGQAPPTADWGLMIGENRAALLVQPWVVVAPAIAIACLAIGVNLLTDAFARSMGRSVVMTSG